MAQVRVLPFRVLSLRLTDKRIIFSRLCRQIRLSSSENGVRPRPMSAISATGLNPELDFQPDLEPMYAESLTYSMVNSFTEFPSFEEEMLKPLPKNVESISDDPSLRNPLERLKRMGTGWFGVILDFEGIVIENALNSHMEAWLRLAEEESKPRPLQSSLLRAAPMKAEQAISEVLCWGREHEHVSRLARRKEQIFHELTKDIIPVPQYGLYRFLETLKQHNIPIAVCSIESQKVYECIRDLDLWQYVDIVISADDVHRCAPDPEAYAYAAQKLQRPPFRCVVIGSSNHSCEGAHDCGMKYVAAAGSQRLYELNAADLVVKQLDEITMVNLKQLFRHEEFTDNSETGVEHAPAPETQPLPFI